MNYASSKIDYYLNRLLYVTLIQYVKKMVDLITMVYKYQYTSGSRGGGVQGVRPPPPPPPLKNNVKGFNPKYKIISCEWLNLQEMHYIFTKIFFFPGGKPPDRLSYNMSDVNPHLTQCEPPPYSM